MLKKACCPFVSQLMFVLVLAVVSDVCAADNEALNHVRSRYLAAHLEGAVGLGHTGFSEKFAKLLSGARNEKEKAWLVYRWVVQHFRYDSRLAREIGDPSLRSLEYLHQLGGGGCAVYANVIHRLMQMAGLDVRTIYGLAKGGVATARRHGKPVNHVWNAIRVNGDWFVLDATWGAGCVDHEGFKRDVTDLYFMMATEQAALMYFDVDDILGVQGRLDIDPMLFRRLPEHALYAAMHGFSVVEILGNARGKTHSSLVDVFNTSEDFTVIKAPVAKRLSRRRQQTIQLYSAAFEELAVVQGKSWQPLQKRGLMHTLIFVPEEGELMVVG